MHTRNYLTIVSGLPRSGTSLMMQMLHAGGMDLVHDGERSKDRHNPKGYYEDERVKRLREDAAWVHGLEGRALKVVSFLLPALPNDLEYRIVLMERPLDQVLASQNAMINGQSDNSSESAAMCSLLQKQQDTALAWITQRQFPFLRVPYPGLVSDPAGWGGEVNRFLEDRLDVSAMARCVRPELHRQQ